MLAIRACCQQLSGRVRQRPARYARMVLVASLLFYVMYQSVHYSGEDDSSADVPDIDDVPLHPQKLRLRIRTKEARRTGMPPKLPPLLTKEQRRSIAAPIRIAIMTPHYFGMDYAKDITNCSLHGQPLSCTFYQSSNEPDFSDQTQEAVSADAVWWHAPNTCLLPGGPWKREENDSFSVFKARPEQWAVIASMESSAYYRCLENENFMSNFDIKMTYQRAAEVPLIYWHGRYRRMWEQEPPLPFSEKKDAVAFINSNCNPPSGRDEIIMGLRQQPGIRVDAMGACLSGGVGVLKGPEAKHEAFRGYRYCIAIENSIAKDYVTEKVYDAFAAGCLPIYLGAPNINEFIPTMDSIIDFQAYGSAELLAQELHRLSANQTAYLEKFEWQKHPERWGKEFNQLQLHSKKESHTQCQLCQVIAKDRAGIIDPAIGKLLRKTDLSQGGDQSWTNVPRYHVKNLHIHYKLAAEQLG